MSICSSAVDVTNPGKIHSALIDQQQRMNTTSEDLLFPAALGVTDTIGELETCSPLEAARWPCRSAPSDFCGPDKR